MALTLPWCALTLQLVLQPWHSFQSILSAIFGITKAEGEVFEALTILAGLGWSEGLSEEPRRWEGS